jgi:prepilin-type N-terminal cleavage/methylation domain-containing protein
MIGKQKSQSGFTLIEMIVSLGVFSIVVMIAVGALLMLVATNEQLQGEQSVMTNLSFALDSMTREIRTGTHYYCTASGSQNGIFGVTADIDALIGDSYNDCANGAGGQRFQGVSFKESGNSITGSDDRILYFFDRTNQKIYRKVGANAPEEIVSSGIVIRNLEFFVTGSKLRRIGGGNIDDQPAVTMFIEAVEEDAATSKPYYVQTTVTQRTLDL